MTDVVDAVKTKIETEKTETLDLTDVRNVLVELLALVDELDGTECNIEGSRAISKKKAEINRKLMWAEHLADLARVAMMCHYHHFKGLQPRFSIIKGTAGLRGGE